MKIHTAFFAWKDDQGRTMHLGVVADGIGGQTAGELASSMAVQAVKEYFDRQHSVDNMPRHLERAIMTANMAVYQHSQANPQFSGMGTTMVLAAFVEDKLYTQPISVIAESTFSVMANFSSFQWTIRGLRKQSKLDFLPENKPKRIQIEM